MTLNHAQNHVELNVRGLLSRAQWIALRDSLALSPREFEVVQRLLDNKSEEEIAEELELSRHTIHSHLRRLYVKLDVSNRSQLLLRVFAAHLSLQEQERTEQPDEVPRHNGQ